MMDHCKGCMGDRVVEGYEDLCLNCTRSLDDKPTTSCWGCGQDYLNRWEEKDLGKVWIDGDEWDVCPDCFEELQEQGGITF